MTKEVENLKPALELAKSKLQITLPMTQDEADDFYKEEANIDVEDAPEPIEDEGLNWNYLHGF